MLLSKVSKNEKDGAWTQHAPKGRRAAEPHASGQKNGKTGAKQTAHHQ